MPTFTETVETIRAEEASIGNLFGGDTRLRDRRRTPEYRRNLLEAANFIADIADGRRPLYHLQEAMSTSDFPLMFADVLDRQLLANYQETQPVWQNFVRRGTVPDFRNVKRFAVDGAEATLPLVNQREEYPEAPLSESQDQYSVAKYGRRLDLSWETLVNDDLDAFRSAPQRLARAARRTEDKFATQLYVDANGPHASLYTSGNKNIINATNAGAGFTANNPPLSIDGLQQALVVLANMKDADGEPIVIESVELVVPPALEVVAQNILNATVIRTTAKGGNTNGELEAVNWMARRMRLSVSPYIPVVATTNGNASWFLFANPSTGRPALELGFLRGYEQPALYERVPNARRIGGGEAMESFEDDSVAWRVRHVIGGTRLVNTGGAKATVASNGSGS